MDKLLMFRAHPLPIPLAFWPDPLVQAVGSCDTPISSCAASFAAP